MPDDVRGRIFALDFGVDMTANSISALILGALAQTVAIRPLLVGLGVIAIVFGLVWTALTRPLWTELIGAADED
jgi:uncharacterized membrane protein